MLRASVSDPETDINVVTSEPEGKTVPCSAELTALAEAVFHQDSAAAREAREKIAQAINPQAAIDAIAVAAHFNAITRIADATGVELDRFTSENSADLRETLGLDAYLADK